MDKSKLKAEQKRLTKEFQAVKKLAESAKMPLARASYQKKLVKVLSALLEVNKHLPVTVEMGMTELE